MKKIKYQLWDMQESIGIEFETEMKCLEHIMDVSDYTSAFYFLIMKDKNKVLKTVIYDRGNINWVNHES